MMILLVCHCAIFSFYERNRLWRKIEKIIKAGCYISANVFDHISDDGEKMTVLELVERYLETKTGVKQSTREGYKTTVNFMKKDPMGARMIASIRVSDAKIWMIRLQKY